MNNCEMNVFQKHTRQPKSDDVSVAAMCTHASVHVRMSMYTYDTENHTEKTEER